MRAALYSRVSSEEQTLGFSLDAQLAAMRAYCHGQGWEIVVEFVEAGLSARTDNRPQFKAMIAQAKAHKFDVIVVHKLDRFARNREDAVVYKGLLKRIGVRVVSVTEPLDDGPMGTLVEGMLETVAEWYSVNLAQETKEGKRQRATNGLHNNRLSFGYRKGADGIAEIDPNESPGVLLAFSNYVTGCYSDQEIATILNGEGYRTRHAYKRLNPGHPWSKDTVCRMLRNPFYAGQVHYHDELMPGKHPPLIDLAMFNRCLQIRRSKFKTPGSGKAQRIYELAGLIFCVACGAPLRAHSAGTGTYYRCTTRERGGNCSQTSARHDVVEQEVDSLIASVTLDDGWRQKVLAHLSSGEPTAAEVSKRRSSLEGKLARAKELYVSGDIDRERYLRLKVECENEIASLSEPDIVDIEQVIALLTTPAEMWSKATAEERKQRNRLLFEAAHVENKHVVAVKLRGTFQKLRLAEATGFQPAISALTRLHVGPLDHASSMQHHTRFSDANQELSIRGC